MLVNTKKMLDKANKKNYGIPHANVVDQHTLKAAIKACKELKMPLIIGWAEVHEPFITMEEVVHLSKLYLRDVDVSVAIHLDHGSSIEVVKKAIEFGFTSVMFDGSMLPIEENIAKTKEVVEYAHQLGITVEAELGHVGQGSDDDIEYKKADLYTKPEEAVRFVKETGIDSLAIAIGTAHGEYKKAPSIDYERLNEIKKVVDVPLVLHGSSGTGLDKLQKCVDGGINKINICTDLLKAGSLYLKENANKKLYDKLSLEVENAIKDCLKEYYKALKTQRV